MPYLCCLCICFLFFYIFEGNIFKTKLNHNAVKFILVLPLLYCTLFLGLQYAVGTDYYSYYSIFENPKVNNYYANYKKEYGFVFIASVVQSFLHPQWGFVFLAAIQMFCFYLFILQSSFKRIDLFFLCFFCFCTAFMNQTNILRQYTAAYIFLAGVYFIYKRNILLYIITIILCSLFHRSSLLLLLFYGIFSLQYRFRSVYFFMFEFCLVLLISVIGIDTVIEKVVKLTIYSSYLGSAYNNKSRSLLNTITKIIYAPFYIHFLLVYAKKVKEESKNNFLISIGFFSYCFKLVAGTSFYLGRFASYIEIFSCLPLYFYLLEIIKSKKIYSRLLYFFIIFCVALGPFILKTCIFPSGEYAYKSILTR